MSLYKKNVLVGVTVLVALLLLGWMVLQFSDAPFRFFAKKQMPVTFVAASAEGLSEGSPVYYRGVSVGRVAKIRHGRDLETVDIDSLLDVLDPPLPANVVGEIRSQLFGGGSSIRMVLFDPADNLPASATAPATSASTQLSAGDRRIRPIGNLAPSQKIRAEYVGIDILPRELSVLSEELRKTAIQLRESQLVPRMVEAVNAIKADMEKAGKLIDHLDELVGDEKMQKDLKEIVANFRKTSESAAKVGVELEALAKKASVRLDQVGETSNQLLITANARMGEVSKSLSDRLAQVAKVLENMEAASKKINEGNGTAAMLINNPALYETLLEASRELALTMGDARRLVQQWEQEGMYLKLSDKK